jgi:hypothetical protein
MIKSKKGEKMKKLLILGLLLSVGNYTEGGVCQCVKAPCDYCKNTFPSKILIRNYTARTTDDDVEYSLQALAPDGTLGNATNSFSKNTVTQLTLPASHKILVTVLYEKTEQSIPSLCVGTVDLSTIEISPLSNTQGLSFSLDKKTNMLQVKRYTDLEFKTEIATTTYTITPTCTPKEGEKS